MKFLAGLFRRTIRAIYRVITPDQRSHPHEAVERRPTRRLAKCLCGCSGAIDRRGFATAAEMIAVGAYASRLPYAHYLGLENFKIDMDMIAAFMTIAGYSLNDTIVIFDRVRENLRLMRRQSFFTVAFRSDFP